MFPAGAAFSDIDITIICSILLRGCMPAGWESLFPLVCFACSAVLGTLQVLHICKTIYSCPYMCMNRCVSGQKEITVYKTLDPLSAVCVRVCERGILYCDVKGQSIFWFVRCVT